jgi:hypothetical protein
MSKNYDNDILPSEEENLEFIDDEEEPECDFIADNSTNQKNRKNNFIENTIKKICISIYKFIKEIFIFIFKIGYKFILSIKKNNESQKNKLKSQNDNSNSGNNGKIFNKYLLANKEKFISNNQNTQDNSGINDILGIDSNISIKNKNKNIVLTCKNKNKNSNSKNKLCSHNKKNKQKYFGIDDICCAELGDKNLPYKKNHGTDTDAICELFKL